VGRDPDGVYSPRPLSNVQRAGVVAVHDGRAAELPTRTLRSLYNRGLVDFTPLPVLTVAGERVYIAEQAAKKTFNNHDWFGEEE
jgi:hypothetical protein